MHGEQQLQSAFTLQVGPIGRTERLAAMSWQRAGLSVTCFTYAPEADVDRPIIGAADYADADSVMPREMLAKLHPQTAIGLFAAHGLLQGRGVWIDPDYVLVKSLPDARFVAIARHLARGATIRPQLLRVPTQHPMGSKMIDELLAHDGPRARDVAVANSAQLYWPQKHAAILDEASHWPVSARNADALYGRAPRAFRRGDIGGVCCHRDAAPHGPTTLDRILHPNAIRQQDGATGDPCWYSALWRQVFQLPGTKNGGRGRRLLSRKVS